MANDQELRYKITTQADTAGAEAAADAIGKIDKANKDTKQSGDAAGAAMKSAGRDLGQVQNATRAIGELARGNIGAFRNFGQVLGGIGTALKTNPLFLIGSIAATVIVPALAKIKAGWQESAKAAEEAGKRTNEALAAARVANTEKRTNALAEQFAEITKRAEEAEKAIRRATAAAIEQIDAEEAVELAMFEDEAKAQGYGDTQKTVGRARIQAEARRRREVAQLAEIDRSVEGKQRAAEQLRDRLPTAQEEADRARGALDTFRARSPEVIQQEIQDARDRLRGFAFGRGAGANVDPQQLKQTIASLEDELKKRETVEGSLVESLEVAEARLNERIEETRKALETAFGAEEEARFRRGSITGQRALQDELSNREVRRALAGDGIPAGPTGTSFVQPQLRDRERRIVGTATAERGGAQAALNNVATAVEGAPAAPPLDVEPLRRSIITFQGKVIDITAQNQRAISAVAKDVERLSARVDNLSASSQ